MRPVDFRKGHAGLSLIVQEVLGRDPYIAATRRKGLDRHMTRGTEDLMLWTFAK
jgi:hypothetical protein